MKKSIAHTYGIVANLAKGNFMEKEIIDPNDINLTDVI
jgi:hypothetical protein